MKLKDLLLVTINDGYKPRNGLFTYEELKQYCQEQLRIPDHEMLQIAEQVLVDRNEKKLGLACYGLEIWHCEEESQLLGFIRRTEENFQKGVCKKLICSEDCEQFLFNRGLAVDGSFLLSGVKYQVQDVEFQVGQRIDNFNGNGYKIMEVYKKDNLLLLNEKTNEYMVAYGIHSYMRFPANEKQNPIHKEYGVEWQHGRYLKGVPSEIDFVGLKQEYGTDYNKKGEEFQIEIREILSRVENVKAENLGDAIDLAMEMYNDEQIVLNSEDYQGVTFIPKEESR